MIIVIGKRNRLKRFNSVLLWHAMLRIDLSINDDEIKWHAKFLVEHEKFAPSDLTRFWGTESKRETILDLRYSRKSVG